MDNPSENTLELFNRRSSVREKAFYLLLKKALLLDASKDITSTACLKNSKVKALVKVKQNAVIAGLKEVKETLKPLKVKLLVKEYQQVRSGDNILVIEGNVKQILAKERFILNTLMILSGVATRAYMLSKKFGRRIAATRKLHPLLNIAEKRAIGHFLLSHRFTLSDSYLIKDNHLAALCKIEGLNKSEAITRAIKRALKRKKASRRHFLQIEVASLKEAVDAVNAGANAILVDNKRPKDVKRIVKSVRKIKPDSIIEASGNIKSRNILDYLRSGVDFVSMSEITLDAKPVDFSLEII